jgi:alpha-D-xyloside xylohydrolase
MQNYLQNYSFKLLFIFIFQLNVLGGTTDNQLIINIKNVKVRIEVITPSVVRISATVQKDFSDKPSLIVQQIDQVPKYEKNETKNNLIVSTDSVMIKINKNNGEIVFMNKKGDVLLKTFPFDSTSFVPSIISGEKVFHVKQKFKITKDEGLYGLGELEDPIMNYRNHDILIVQANRVAVNPCLVSTHGYGILWDNYSETKFHNMSDTISFLSEAAEQIDYYFMFGSTIDNEISDYRNLTGKAPLYGKWAYGYWQSKNSYMNSAQLLDIVREYRKRDIPLDNIVQDAGYWKDDKHFSGMTWDSSRYPDPKLMIDSVHKMNAHIMVSIWPTFGPESEIYKDMAAHHFLFNEDHWSGGKVYDAYSPEARAIYWKYINQGLFSIGTDAFWMDGSEPEFRCTDDRYMTEISIKKAGENYLGSNTFYLNTYSLETTKGVYEHERETNNKKRVFILTRSTFAGQQKYAAATWSGDTFASWGTLKTQVAAGINFSMSGLPYWTNDIGGYLTHYNYPKGLEDDAYKELFVRWFEFGAFCPIFRTHGADISREVWQFGNKGDWAYDALVKTDDLRYQLMPYIYSLAWEVTNDNFTMMRGLMMDFPNDKHTYSIGNQFMFGPSLMIVPVTKPMYHIPAYNGTDITPDHFYSADGKEHGTKLQVYKGTDFNNLIFTRKFESSQITWIGCLPENLDTSYSLKINGIVKTEKGGNYKFFVQTDAGVKLWINNKLIINKWNNKDTARFEGSIALDGNSKYNFVLYHEQSRKNSAFLKINWITPNKDEHPNEVSVYLPKTNLWYNFWTGQTNLGGENILASSPVDELPIYVPSGSIIPIGPKIQYASEDPRAVLEIRIYQGSNGSFKLYEDENDNYDYEKGLYSIIPFNWNDRRKVLTIGTRKGEFPGMVESRQFNIILVKENHGTGGRQTEHPDRVINYNGKEVKVKL